MTAVKFIWGLILAILGLMILPILIWFFIKYITFLWRVRKVIKSQESEVFDVEPHGNDKKSKDVEKPFEPHICAATDADAE